MADPTLDQMLQAYSDPSDDGPAGDGAASTQDQGEQTPAITDSEVIQWIMGCRSEAFDARRTRMRLNNVNRDAYMGIQDWSYKQKGQSTEFLPKVTVAAEQFGAFVKKALIQYGNWFEVTLSNEVKPYVTDGQIRDLMLLYLGKMPEGTKFRSIETILADAGKCGLLESLIILKVHGRDVKYNRFVVESGENVVSFPSGTAAKPTLSREETSRWHLCVDIVRSEDYFPDPTGRGLYEIHEVERDYLDVLESAKLGVYDLEAVKSLKGQDFPKPEDLQQNRRPQQRGQDREIVAPHRQRVLLTEFWGSIINAQGELIGRNKLATVANKNTLIRRAVDNPLWHGETPFIAEPLIRVPHSVWHKALYDASSALNFAINEVFNLLLDGGIAAVWGIKQCRPDMLKDQKQIEGGIPQGMTLLVKAEVPEGMKVVEACTEADPATIQHGLPIFEMLNREFNQASLTNDIMLGELPQRQVKATEIVQSNQANSITLGSISMDMETNIMEVLLRKAWLTLLQHIDDVDREDVVKCIGEKAAMLLLSISEAERFAQFANAASFKVMGLSAVISATQDFQKLMAFFQAVSQNPVLAQSFLKQYSVDKVLKILMKNAHINPDDIANTPDQMAALPQVMQQIAMFAQMLGGGAGSQDGTGGASGMTAPAGPQGPTLAAPPGSPVGAMTAVNQQIQPLSGMNLTAGGGPGG